MKRFFMTCFICLFSLNLLAAEQELPLKIKADGQPVFSIQYAYDSDFVWMFVYSTTISNQTPSVLPDKVYWNVVNVVTNELIAEWTPIDKKMLLVGSLRISSRPTLESLLPNLKNAKVVYGVKNPQGSIEVLFSIPMGPLCQNYPNHIADLTNKSNKACEVKVEDLPDWQSECKEWETELLNYVKQGVYSCKLAKKQYANKGCGELACQ